MNPSKVLLITLVGPYGEVDVAVRADLPAAELLPAFNELVGIRRGDDASGDPGRPESSQSRTPGQSGGSQPVRTPPSGPAASAPQQSSASPAARPSSGRHAAPGGPGGPTRPAAGFAGGGGQESGRRYVSEGRGQGPGAPVPAPGRSQGTSGPGQGSAAQRDRRDIPLSGTLADAGIVDGTVIHLYRASREQREQERSA